MNKTICHVIKIRSYQTLVYKNGTRTFPKKAYKKYKQELHQGMEHLIAIDKETPIKAVITFNIKEAVDLPKFVVKMIETQRTSKLFDTEEEARDFMTDKHQLEYRPPVIKYGAAGDMDNISKPILDYLEEIGIIDNDRYIVDMRIKKTFNNSEESIEIELREMEVVVKENGQYVFE